MWPWQKVIQPCWRSIIHFHWKENKVGRLLTGEGTWNQFRLCWYSLKTCCHFLHSDILRQNDSHRPTGMLDDWNFALCAILARNVTSISNPNNIIYLFIATVAAVCSNSLYREAKLYHGMLFFITTTCMRNVFIQKYSSNLFIQVCMVYFIIRLPTIYINTHFAYTQ